MNSIDKIDYSKLHHLAIARMGEYWTKYMLTMHDLDVYTTEVDNKGIDFIIRGSNGAYYDIQVKFIRYPSTSYVFITKEKEWDETNLRPNLILALVLYKNNESPELFLIPSTAWLTPNELLKNRNYSEQQKSKPEWGVYLSEKNFGLLEKYNAVNIIKNFTIAN